MPFRKYWGTPFNCLTAHVAELSQLHPMHSAQTFAENWKLLGLNPNQKPTCCFKSLKKNKNPKLCKSRPETKGRGEEEHKRRTV